MGKTRTLMQEIAQRFQLPGDIIAGMPKIELTGRQMFALEPHRGLMEYGDREICISSPIGPLRIRGSGLRIARMNNRRITVEGSIDTVEWLDQMK